MNSNKIAAIAAAATAAIAVIVVAAKLAIGQEVQKIEAQMDQNHQ